MILLISALTLLIGHQKVHSGCKKTCTNHFHMFTVWGWPNVK